MDGKVIGSCECLINDNLFDFNPRVINLLLVGESGWIGMQTYLFDE